jgi:predicted flap endonuclease-1-like 5' DNA nuclease
MAEKDRVPTDWFWTAALVAGALVMGGTFAVAIGRIAGAGAAAGLFFGAIIFVATAWFVGSFVSAANLPPPNTLTAPTVPRSGSSPRRQEPAHGSVGEEMPETVGGKFSKVSYHTGEAVRALGAAVGQAATEVTGAVGSVATELSGTVVRRTGGLKSEILPAATPVDVPLPEEPASVSSSRPAGMPEPREGGADDLKQIKGVGPRLEALLHGLGYYHFDQIGAWTPEEVAWVDSNLEGFKGRVTRDGWVAQARVLSAGGTTEFSQRVERGEVYDD